MTSSIDVTVDYIIRKYSNEINFYRVNIDKYAEYEFVIGYKNEWTIKHYEWHTPLISDDIYSIYYRKPRLPDLSEFEYAYQHMIAKDIISLVNGLVDSFDGKVLTKPYILRKTENKIFQLLYAQNNNFLTPSSFIGNSNEIAKKFLCNKSIIKPLTLGKIQNGDFIELYQTNYFTQLDQDISLSPVYLQNYIEKKYEVRMTYINGFYYPVRIDSIDKLDWRKDYKGHRYSIIDCPSSIIRQCDMMIKQFDLNFGAFDFIVDNLERWIFLEVNPNGQWLWLEESLNLTISQKIIEYLGS